MIEKTKSIRVAELADMVGIPESSLRRYLRALEAEGKIKREKGWAHISGPESMELPFRRREKENVESKKEIAKVAAELVGPGQTIILGAGTTTLFMAKILKKRLFDPPITVVTNCLPILKELSDASWIRTITLGGELNVRNLSLTGSLTIHCLEKISAKSAFIGATAIDPKRGILEAESPEAATYRKMAEVSDRVIIVSDSSKFRKSAPFLVFTFREIDTLITDADAPQDCIQHLRNVGVNVILVNP